MGNTANLFCEKSTSCDHIGWLKRSDQTAKTSCGKQIEIWELSHVEDEEVLSSWAKHFRSHYCDDRHIDELRSGYNFSRSEYLTEIKFPDSSRAPGPSVRAADFAEILIADFLEYVLEFWVPRTRYGDKVSRNESTKGTDLLGFRIVTNEFDSPEDTLAVFEVKAKFTGAADRRLQDAVNDSAKDLLRKAESLNSIKQRLLQKDHLADAQKIDRFQNPEDRPYTELPGAVACLESSLLDLSSLSDTDTEGHPSSDALVLFVMHGSAMMPLVSELYRRAADEA